MNEFNKGQFARRAMELGGFPVRLSAGAPSDHYGEERGFDSPKATISEIRLIAAMRKIDPDLAHMIESLAPVYLVKG